MTVTVERISYHYRSAQVLHGVSFSIGCGVLGLLGPNGAGKTTLLRILATALQPTGGTLTLGGRNPTNRLDRLAVRSRLGYLPQEFGVFPDFTVEEFVEYFALLKGLSPKQSSAATLTAITAVDLVSERRQRLKTLSGGMLRRAGIAQAIVNRPEVLLLDEPTIGLDPQQRFAFRALIKRLGQICSVVVSTHLVEDIAAACSDVVVLDRGHVKFVGSPIELAHRGTTDDIGDTELERGYSAILKGSSSDQGV
jgi:ABC-type multidrug transport system ATPase subunit